MQNLKKKKLTSVQIGIFYSNKDAFKYSYLNIQVKNVNVLSILIIFDQFDLVTKLRLKMFQVSHISSIGNIKFANLAKFEGEN